MVAEHKIPSPECPENPITGNLSKAVKLLLESSCIGFEDICPIRQRYVNLRAQDIFDNLVDLYAQLFTTQWQHYTGFMRRYPPPSDVSPHIYVARCYISMWFIDLYVSNREAVRKLSSVAFHERYQGKLCLVSNEYDEYLTLLNASISPTHIKNAIDNAQYIPIIADSINVNLPNPFGINYFTPERCVFYGITRIMKASNLWRFTPLSSDANGRPCWLFDWHSEDNACSWFPSEGNYDLEDVTLAYILGTACTPNLGARDVDDWQYFAEGVIPQDPNPLSYDRVDERQFYGSYEVRTMEIDPDFCLAQILSQVDQPMPQFNQTMPRFQLIDWVYYCRVIMQMDDSMRIIALRGLSLV